MSNLWAQIEVELVYWGFLLRVSRTRSPNRYRWIVMPIREVKKRPMWFSEHGKGASVAEAKGYSLTLESAKADAVAMADAIEKSAKSAASRESQTSRAVKKTRGR